MLSARVLSGKDGQREEARRRRGRRGDKLEGWGRWVEAHRQPEKQC